MITEKELDQNSLWRLLKVLKTIRIREGIKKQCMEVRVDSQDLLETIEDIR
jgi:hypothetical protein